MFRDTRDEYDSLQVDWKPARSLAGGHVTRTPEGDEAMWETQLENAKRPGSSVAPMPACTMDYRNFIELDLQEPNTALPSQLIKTQLDTRL